MQVQPVSFLANWAHVYSFCNLRYNSRTIKNFLFFLHNLINIKLILTKDRSNFYVFAFISKSRAFTCRTLYCFSLTHPKCSIIMLALVCSMGYLTLWNMRSQQCWEQRAAKDLGQGYTARKGPHSPAGQQRNSSQSESHKTYNFLFSLEGFHTLESWLTVTTMEKETVRCTWLLANTGSILKSILSTQMVWLASFFFLFFASVMYSNSWTSNVHYKIPLPH